MKKIIALTLSILMVALLFCSCGGEKAPYEKSEAETNLVLLDVKGCGQIVVELYPDVAPITVENFKSLVAKGFYDGLIFHRIYEGFMIQGGDPEGNGTGGNEDENGNEINIKGEFAANGVENNLSHERGVISMARANDPDSASSQFFIMHQSTYKTSLDGLYAAFGKVVYGMEVVDEIATVETTWNAYGTEKTVPLKEVVMESVYFVNPIN